MATLKDFYHGARPKTLSAAVAPVAIGGSLAYVNEPFDWSVSLACLIVALALQVGVNFSNDYSDGIKGTDHARVGPVRLVGQKIASPRAVLIAALSSFFVAAVAGLYVAAQSSWWMIAVGAACIALAWLYTGSKHPYGYYGFGELVVFICFGLVATVGTFYANTLHITFTAIAGSIIPGMFSVMILLANNIRDIAGDTQSGKKTLAVRIGAHCAQTLFLIAGVLILLATIALGFEHVWVLLALIGGLPIVFMLVKTLRSAKNPPDYIKVLVATSRFNLIYSIIISVLILISGKG